MPRNEVLTLRWQDVDLEARVLSLADNKTGPRAVPLSSAAARVLADQPRVAGSPWVTLEALAEAIRVIVNGITVEGTQMADERESLMWGFVNMLHSQAARLDRTVDRIVPEMRDFERAQDGNEVKAWELQLLTDRARNLGDRRDAFEKMRDLAADAYRAETGDTWRPRHGSHTSQTGTLTSAAIDARDFRRARNDRETRAHLPDGTLIAVTGGKTVNDVDTVWNTLDRAHAKYGDMVLVHGGGPGTDRIAAQRAERNGVHQIVCNPDWDRHGRAVPIRRCGSSSFPSRSGAGSAAPATPRCPPHVGRHPSGRKVWIVARTR